MAVVAPAHQVQALARPHESIDVGVAQSPSSGAGVKLMGRDAVEHIEHPTVGDHHDLLIGVARGELCDAGLNASAQLDQAFSFGRQPMGVARLPSFAFNGEFVFQLLPRQALKVTKMALSELGDHARGKPQRGGQRFGGVMGSGQVAAIHCIDGLVAQGGSKLLGLPTALVIEIDVQVALDAGDHVPIRLTVANDYDAGEFHGGGFW